MWPFARKPLVDPEMTEWMLDHAEWLLRHHARKNAFARARLMPISTKYFPIDGLRGHALAESLFERVRFYMGVEDLSLRLVEDPLSGRFSNDSANGYSPQPLANAAGTYRASAGEISYDSSLLKHPPDLVAVLAHELSHAVLDLGASVAPPSDNDFDELLTDFCSVFLGFGLFQIAFRQPINPATREIAEQWHRLYMYYINRREGCTATALFARLHDIDPALVLRAADVDCRGALKRAFADLDAHMARINDIRDMLVDAKQFAIRATIQGEASRPKPASF